MATEEIVGRRRPVLRPRQAGDLDQGHLQRERHRRDRDPQGRRPRCNGWASTTWMSSISTPSARPPMSIITTSWRPPSSELKEQGKVRHVGITETSPSDPEQKMLTRAIQEAPWEVTMLAYSLMNQGARRQIFPETRAPRDRHAPDVRRPQHLQQRHLSPRHLRQAGRAGRSRRLDPVQGDPLAFLVGDGGPKASRTPPIATRATNRVDVVLFGTGNKAHVKGNVDSILRPPWRP